MFVLTGFDKIVCSLETESSSSYLELCSCWMDAFKWDLVLACCLKITEMQ